MRTKSLTLHLTIDDAYGLLLCLKATEAAWRAADISFQAPWGMHEVQQKIKNAIRKAKPVKKAK